MTKRDLRAEAKDYAKETLQRQVYYIYQTDDDEVLDIRQKYDENADVLKTNDFIPIGTRAFTIIDYEKALPVVVMDRKGFFYYCSETDGHQHYIISHQLFPTEEAAKNKIIERNLHRDAAIEKYHLLDHSDNEKVNHDREYALEWLYYDQDPPELLIEELTQYVVDRK